MGRSARRRVEACLLTTNISTVPAIIRTLNRDYPYPYRDYPYPYRDYPYPYRDYPYRAQGSGLTQAVDGELPLAHARDFVAVLCDPPKYLRFVATVPIIDFKATDSLTVLNNRAEGGV